MPPHSPQKILKSNIHGPIEQITRLQNLQPCDEPWSDRNDDDRFHVTVLHDKIEMCGCSRPTTLLGGIDVQNKRGTATVLVVARHFETRCDLTECLFWIVEGVVETIDDVPPVPYVEGNLNVGRRLCYKQQRRGVLFVNSGWGRRWKWEDNNNKLTFWWTVLKKREWGG